MQQELFFDNKVPYDVDDVHCELAQTGHPIGSVVREVSRRLYGLSYSKEVMLWPKDILRSAIHALLAVEMACRLGQENKLGAALVMAAMARQHTERLRAQLALGASEGQTDTGSRDPWIATGSLTFWG
jgi:hypothetical protein